MENAKPTGGMNSCGLNGAAFKFISMNYLSHIILRFSSSARVNGTLRMPSRIQEFLARRNEGCLIGVECLDTANIFTVASKLTRKYQYNTATFTCQSICLLNYFRLQN